MFKSLFFKYITAFMLIIVVSFMLLIVIIGNIINGYSEQVKTDLITNSAAAAYAYVDENYQKDIPFSQFVAQNSQRTSDILQALTVNADGITILLADADGTLLMSRGVEQSLFEVGQALPLAEMNEVLAGQTVHGTDTFAGELEQPHVVHAYPLLHDGGVYGVLLVCADSSDWMDLRDSTVQVIMAASLWVMLAALIAFYFITERIITPLKEMSRAAKSFAAGRFDVRVPVHGNDEVAELATAMNNMAQSLEALDKMRTSFMANVSHDLRTPMTTISGFIDSILEGAIPAEQQSYYLGIVSEEVKRLSRLVTQLLDLSRIQAGDRKFVSAPFDVCEVSRLILISFEQKIDEKRLEVEFACDDEHLYVLADRDAMYQIVYNLVDNAVKFSREGGVLRICLERVRKGQKIRVRVYNQGQGIAKEDLPYVFERFYKSDKSRGLDKKGVGLGLYIAKTIIEAHHETISVDSVAGEWCEFTFTLPEVSAPEKE
ncbi:MAG: HAMP domain-containing histidine kinase [Clostridia bacterium]|nr:HAMP domain-containing histidine kinase [Clostridia bacterium]